MASATVDSAAAVNTVDGGAFRLDSIPIVDLRHLSQSELYSLSRCSSSAFDPNRRDDVVIPIIDRSVFNESAGSRKQIYSRLRLAPSTSSSATPHRRTPHLRSTASTVGSLSNKSDPENAENAHIVNLLKQSFIADMNPEDLVPVKIEYSNSIPTQQFSSPPPCSPSNVGVIVQKRKRGRPRKDEASGYQRELGTGIGVVDVNVDIDIDANVDDADGFSLMNETVVRDNVEDRDREVLNRDGVAVDLVALGAVEHPYWDEIRRKTEGLQTEEELLEFLKGLSGQWGSRRRKKRIVDACDFGSNLPIGWKLSLCIKKKNGHVWLYCRRYISPSGLHFVSCKGVSSYLCSLHGIQDTNVHSFAQYNQMVIDADNLTTVPVMHLAIEEDSKTEKLVSHSSPPALVSTIGDHEIQAVAYTGDLPEDKIGESLQSNKPNLAFIDKDEPLQLQRRNRYKNSTRITDGVIIKDGKYECQFCHKTFSERHRYNGHVGTHGRKSELSLPVNDATYDVTNGGGNENSASKERPEKIIASERWLEDSNDHAEECVAANDSEQIDQTKNELNLDFEKFAVDGSALHYLESQGGQDNNLALHIEKMSDLESIPCQDTTTETSASVLEASKLNKVSNFSIPDIADDEKAPVVDSDPCLIHKGKVDETLSFCIVENENSKADNDGVDNLDKMQFEISPVIPSWNKQEIVLERDDAEVFTHPLMVPGVQDMSKSKLVAADESMYDYESIDDDVCRKKSTVLEFDAFRNFGNTESSDPFSCSHTGINSNSVAGTEQDSKFGACSPFASATDKQLFAENNMIRIFNDALEEQREEPYGGVLLCQSSVSEVSDEARMLNKMYTTPSNPSKLSTHENNGNYELSLSFGKLQTDICTDSNKVGGERYQDNSFNIDSVVHKTYGDPQHLSIVGNNIPSDMKENRHFETEFPSSSFNDSAHEFDSSFNMARPGRGWNGTPGDNLGTSGQNFMVGFRNGSQSGEGAGADGTWRTVHQNAFDGCFNANSGPQIPPSSCFQSFGLTSAKDGEGSFGVNKNYVFQSNMLRPGKIQPVEYSFMGEQSSNSLPGESKIYSYNTNMEQGLDPSFWLGKDSLTPNACHSSQVTSSICVWCRGVFFHDPMQDGVQTGAIGTMCPSCSSRIPGQFNLL